jgi:hypothetical protein
VIHKAANDSVPRWTSHEAFRAWVRTLKTGDVVLVCDWFRCRAVVQTTVKVTPSGRVYLPHYEAASRVDWGKSFRIDRPGAGDRFIAPLPEVSS